MSASLDVHAPSPVLTPPRVQFVELHSEPLLQHLYENFKQQYPGVTFPAPPPTGPLRLEDVMKSTYFFS